MKDFTLELEEMIRDYRIQNLGKQIEFCRKMAIKDLAYIIKFSISCKEDILECKMSAYSEDPKKDNKDALLEDSDENQLMLVLQEVV